MSRQTKGPRLYLRKGRKDGRTGQVLADRWFIRDGIREIGTGCGSDALDQAEQALAVYIGGKWTEPARESDPRRVPIADALALYGHAKADKLRSDGATMLGFVDHLLEFWGTMKLSDVRGQTCRDYVGWRIGQPIRHGRTGRKVSDQTARRELEVLSAAIGYWDRENNLTSRPSVTLPEKRESNRDALTRNDASRLLRASMGHRIAETGWAAIPGSGSANRAHLRRFLLIGLYTGTRAGVIMRLVWSESPTEPWVDLDAGVIYRRGRDERVSTTKRRPLVKIPRRLLAHLRRWRAADLDAGHHRVIHHGGRQVTSVRRSFAASVVDAGLSPSITPHWLRHTAATWLMERGVDPWQAAGYLGMTVQTLEKHYAHARPDHQSAARRAMR